MGLVSERAGMAKVSAHPERRVRWVVGGHDHICTLPDSEGDHIGVVRLNWDEVVGHNGHVVAVDAEAL